MISESERPYWITLAGLLTTCALIHGRRRRRRWTCSRRANDDDDGDGLPTQDQHSVVKLLNLQRRYLGAFFLALFADWLQGPYIYRLYKSYGFSPVHISALYVVGFAASAVLGIAAGATADRYGRKRSVLAGCALYAACCFLKVFDDFRILVCARLLGGMATSMLFSAFESWYVYEHVRRNNLLPEWMSSTFAATTFWNSALAVGAGILSNGAAETLALGPVAPFLLAIPFLLACIVFTATFWSENYGSADKPHGYVRSFCDGLDQVLSRRPIQLLAVVQALFESAMHVFVFVWTPILDAQPDAIQPTPIGLVFACFMVCMTIGASIHNVVIHDLGWPAKHVLLLALGVALSSMVLATVATATVTYLTAFFLFEVSVGLYFPAISYLRSTVVPESHRIAVLNWFRLPMNAITCVALFYLPRSSDVVGHELDGRRVFAVCSAGLCLAVCAALSFVRSSWTTDCVLDKINI